MTYKSQQCFLRSFKPIGLSIQEDKRKIDFQDGHHNGHLGFLIGRILAIFDLQVNPMLPAKFHVSCLSVQEKKRKIDFQDGHHGSHLGFQIGTILSIFDLQVTQCFLPSFMSIGLSKNEVFKNKTYFNKQYLTYILFCSYLPQKKTTVQSSHTVLIQKAP